MKKSKTQNSKRYPESLGKISVKNFRVFDTETSFDFKPLTFLIGPNSSGKSSLMKLFSAISSSANKSKNNKFVPRLISSNIGDDSSMGFSFNSSRPLPNEPLEIIINGANNCQSLNLQFKLSYVDSETFLNKIRLSSFEMLQNNQLILKVVPIPKTNDLIISFSFKGYYDLGGSYIHSMIHELKSRKGFVFNDEMDPLLEARNSATVFKLKEMDDFEIKTIQEIERKVFNIDEFISNSSENNKFQHTLLLGYDSLDGYMDYGLKGIIDYMFYYLKSEISKKFSNNISIDDLKKSALGNILLQKLPDHISSELKANLNRNLTFNRVPVFKSERETVFNLYSDDNTAFGLLIKSYIVRNKNYFQEGILASDDYIDSWLNRFEIGISLYIESIENSFQYFKIYVLKDNGSKTNISDLGYGAGQILAYILLPYFLNLERFYSVDSFKSSDLNDTIKKEKKTKTPKKEIDFNPFLNANGMRSTYHVYLEEPETNLHPNWQSILAELFAFQITKGIRFVIETHSEYFVRKIQNLIAKKECDNKDFVIYYFNSEKEKRMNDQPTIREIHINENGTLNQSFGPGFFDEAGKLSLELLSINSIRKN
jgi:predicted ATPase